MKMLRNLLGMLIMLIIIVIAVLTVLPYLVYMINWMWGPVIAAFVTYSLLAAAVLAALVYLYGLITK